MAIHLYVKKCTHCELRYFGKTMGSDPISYTGSGIYWKDHLKKHNSKQETLELFSFYDEEEARDFAIKFSEDNNIVESKEWANLIVENISGGRISGWQHTEETRQKMRNPKSNSAKMGKYERTQEWKDNKSKILLGKEPWNKGKTGVYSEATLCAFRENARNRGDVWKEKQSIAQKSRPKELMKEAGRKSGLARTGIKRGPYKKKDVL